MGDKDQSHDGERTNHAALVSDARDSALVSTSQPIPSTEGQKDGGAPPPPLDRLSFSPNVEKIRSKATLLAMTRNHRKRGVAHLLLAMTLTPDGRIWFRNAELTLEGVRRSCRDALDEEPVEDKEPLVDDIGDSESLTMVYELADRLAQAELDSGSKAIHVRHFLAAVIKPPKGLDFSHLLRVPEPTPAERIENYIKSGPPNTISDTSLFGLVLRAAVASEKVSVLTRVAKIGLVVNSVTAFAALVVIAYLVTRLN